MLKVKRNFTKRSCLLKETVKKGRVDRIVKRQTVEEKVYCITLNSFSSCLHPFNSVPILGFNKASQGQTSNKLSEAKSGTGNLV